MNTFLPAAAPDAAHAALQDLRLGGRCRVDSARFRYLEALARRIPAQPEPLRRLLHARFEAALAAFAAEAGQAGPARGRRAASKEPPSSLAQLVQVLRDHRPDQDAATDRDELASVRRFRAAWDEQRALEELELALARRPAQAGPLSSHALVLQSLELMRTVSPQYLRQFVLQVETLQWLEVAQEKLGESPQRQGRKASGKGARPAQGVRTRPAK